MVVVIFSLLMVFSMQGIMLVGSMERRDRDETASETEFFRAFSIISQDMLHLRARPTRSQFGDIRPALVGVEDQQLVEFTRGGLPLLPSSPGGMMRVAYRLDDEGNFIRAVWPALDGPIGRDPLEQILIQGIDEASFEFLGSDNFFVEVWPPINAGGNQALEMPRMLEVRLQSVNGYELRQRYLGISSVQPSGPSGPNEGDTGGRGS